MSFLAEDMPADHPIRRYSQIHRVDLVVRSEAGSLTAIRLNSSFELFRRLDRIGKEGGSIVYFAQAGRSLEKRSLGALNAFLRVGGGVSVWVRVGGGNHRWAWSDFVRWLGLRFRA